MVTSQAISPHVEKARNLTLLVMLLMALHILFGITGVIGMLVAHMKRHSTQGTIYETHLLWLIVTFWVALAGYAVAFWAWSVLHMLWPLFLVTGFVAYRLSVNLRHWLAHQRMERVI